MICICLTVQLYRFANHFFFGFCYNFLQGSFEDTTTYPFCVEWLNLQCSGKCLLMYIYIYIYIIYGVTKLLENV
jgi:hypothetical protein